MPNEQNPVITNRKATPKRPWSKPTLRIMQVAFTRSGTNPPRLPGVHDGTADPDDPLDAYVPPTS